MKKVIIGVIIVVITSIVSNIVCFQILVHNKFNCQNVGIDTTYSKVRIDSIITNITIRDSIIVKIKEDEKEEINEALNDDDSTAVKRFYQLVNE